MLAGDNW